MASLNRQYGSGEQPACEEHGSSVHLPDNQYVQGVGRGVSLNHGLLPVPRRRGLRGLSSRWRPGCSTRTQRSTGFTMIEMMIVISIMLILISIAAPLYSTSIVRAREAVLRQDLFTLRSLINQYTQDKQKAPQALDDLVTAGYLKQIPKDPFTNSNTTWQVEQEDVLLSLDQSEPGISDVHSGSNATGSDGTPYSQW